MGNTMGFAARPRPVLWALTTLIALMMVGIDASAQREPMTREQIVQLARSGMGHGYKWGGSTWTTDGSRMGKCVKDPPDGDGCPRCTFPEGKVGADCAGFVGKVWQLTRPTPVDEHFRPYSASHYFEDETEWKEIDFNNLKQGDAVARSSHTVIFNEIGADGKLKTWEAMGCEWNMKEGSRNIDPTSGVEARRNGETRQWRAIRRMDLRDAVTCADNPCGDRGDCSEGRCDCKDNYITSPDADPELQCNKCAEGFVNHPTCQVGSAICTAKGTLSCETSFPVNPAADGNAELAGYSCGGGGDEKELAYRFAPTESGKVTFSVDGGSLRVMRGDCAPEACIAEITSSKELEYGGNEVYFVAVESEGGTSPITVSVDCDPEGGVWIGDPCSEDADCEMRRTNGDALSGFCYNTEMGGGFCATQCDRGCPDLTGKAETFCVEDPANETRGICVSKSARQNNHCTTVPGVAERRVNRFMDETAEEAVCLPVSEAESCEGTLSGSVIDFFDRAPVEGGRVDIVDSNGDPVVPSLEIDELGEYVTDSLPCGDYTLAILADGYLPAEISATVSRQANSTVTRLQALLEDVCEEGGIQGSVFDGLTEVRELIIGAEVSIIEGVDNFHGNVIDTVETGVDGGFFFEGLAPGNYTLVVELAGYSQGRTNVVVCGGEELGPADISIVELAAGQMRIVLEWDRPDDLDLHLQLPDGDEVFFWEPCRVKSAAGLDIDRTTAVGPETITVANPGPGTHTVFVHNYSAHEAGGESFSESGARVTVYGDDDQELARFAVPSSDAFFWNVFSFKGEDPQSITALQQVINSRPNPAEEYTEECRP
jgi:hypothetical protein